jgi:mRNA-degrading endonuclease RelE of RelBE toxin-antitoxin system
MNSRITEKFLKTYRRLPDDVRTQARKSYRLFQENPQHPSLHFKLIRSSKPIYSARINIDYRTIGRLEGDTIIWFWIGSHSEYDQLISRL